MDTKKQVARKLIETILYTYADRLLKRTGNPAGLTQYFEGFAGLGKFDKDLIVKAVQYFMQLSFRFELNKTNLAQLCIALGVPNSTTYKLCDISRSRVCDIKRERDKIWTFLERCPEAQFAYDTDLTLTKYYLWLLETSVAPDKDFIALANLIKETLEDIEDEYIEI